MVITNAVVHTGADGVIPDGFVAWQDGRIVDVGAMRALSGEHGAVLDAAGGHVCPGFVDAHTHLGLFPDGGPYDEDRLNAPCPIAPDFSVLQALDADDGCFDEALRAGVTTVLTAPGSRNPVAGRTLCLKTAGSTPTARILRDAPVGLKLAMGQTPERTLGTDAAGLAAVLWQCFETARDGALAAARAGQLPVYVHVHRAGDIAAALALREEFGLWMVLVHGTDAPLAPQAIAAAGVGVITGPAMTDRSRGELKNLSPEGPARLARAGVRVSICTDHPETPAKLLAVCAALAVRGGMEPEEALAAITWCPAQAMGLAHRLGALRPGMDADLLLTPAHPLDITQKPSAVFLGGKRVI